MISRKWMLVMVFLLAGLFMAGCGEKPEPVEAELAALNDILGTNHAAGDFVVITKEIMTPERKKKFTAVKKVFITPEGDYAFISKPVAYNGPVDIAVVIDKQKAVTTGMRIIQHVETDHYVRDMEKNWFTRRFNDKKAEDYLQLVHLEAVRDNEIIIITGATVTTEGIVNGVNACMGVFQEAELEREAAAVPYMVKFERPEEEGPEETGTIAIRSYGVVLGEVTLDQIRQMPSVKRTMSIHSTSGTTSHSFRGTLLSNVIAAVDAKLLENHEWVQPVGVDDYMSDIAIDEVLAENAVYLMYEDNDEPLLQKNGEPGAMRVVVIDDVFGQRFTNYMIEIVLE